MTYDNAFDPRVYTATFHCRNVRNGCATVRTNKSSFDVSFPKQESIVSPMNDSHVSRRPGVIEPERTIKTPGGVKVTIVKAPAAPMRVIARTLPIESPLRPQVADESQTSNRIQPSTSNVVVASGGDDGDDSDDDDDDDDDDENGNGNGNGDGANLPPHIPKVSNLKNKVRFNPRGGTVEMEMMMGMMMEMTMIMEMMILDLIRILLIIRMMTRICIFPRVDFETWIHQRIHFPHSQHSRNK